MPEMTDQDLTELKGLMEKATADNGKPPAYGASDDPPNSVPYDEDWWPATHSAAARALLDHAHALIRAKEREKYLQAVVDACLQHPPRAATKGWKVRKARGAAIEALSAFDAQSETRGGGCTMDDMKTFRALAELCFAIKPELAANVFVLPLGNDTESVERAKDNLAAWALLCDLPNATIESTTESHAAFTNCCLEYACRCRTESGKWNGTAFNRHEAIARCWLAANGVQA